MIGPYYVNTNRRRIEAWGQPCPTAATAGRVTLDGRTFACHSDAVDTFEAYEVIRARHGYRLTGNDTGLYNCRRIRHSTNPKDPWSEHAWGKALDQNWLENPAGNKLVTDMPPAMIADLLQLRTASGAFLLRWGGDWDRDPTTGHSYYDAMHWGEIAHPLDKATGIIIPDGTGDPVTDTAGLKPGDRSNAVGALQATLQAWDPNLGLREDNIYGDATSGAVAHFQRSAGIPDSGVADLNTLIWILTNPSRNPETRSRLDKRHAERLAVLTGVAA